MRISTPDAKALAPIDRSDSPAVAIRAIVKMPPAAAIAAPAAAMTGRDRRVAGAATVTGSGISQHVAPQSYRDAPVTTHLGLRRRMSRAWGETRRSPHGRGTFGDTRRDDPGNVPS